MWDGREKWKEGWGGQGKHWEGKAEGRGGERKAGEGKMSTLPHQISPKTGAVCYLCMVNQNTQWYMVAPVQVNVLPKNVGQSSSKFFGGCYSTKPLTMQNFVAIG